MHRNGGHRRIEGSTLMMRCLRGGGLFSNEAGIGSAPIVHAGRRPTSVRQGLYGPF